MKRRCKKIGRGCTVLRLRLDLLGNILQLWNSEFCAQLLDVVAVELDACADPFQVDVDGSTDCGIWFLTASHHAKVFELGGKVSLALDVRTPQARLFIRGKSEVGARRFIRGKSEIGEDDSLAGASVCIEGSEEILNRLIRTPQKVSDGILGVLHIGEEIIHVGHGKFRVRRRAAYAPWPCDVGVGWTVPLPIGVGG